MSLPTRAKGCAYTVKGHAWCTCTLRMRRRGTAPAHCEISRGGAGISMARCPRIASGWLALYPVTHLHTTAPQLSWVLNKSAMLSDFKLRTFVVMCYGVRVCKRVSSLTARDLYSHMILREAKVVTAAGFCCKFSFSSCTSIQILPCIASHVSTVKCNGNCSNVQLLYIAI